MNRILCIAVGTCLAGSALVAVADTNQMSTTQPTTQPLLDGKVITQNAAEPGPTPSNKPAAFIPPTNSLDGGGNKAGGVMLNNGIGPTVVPGSNGGQTAAESPGINGAVGNRPPTSQPAR